MFFRQKTIVLLTILLNVALSGCYRHIRTIVPAAPRASEETIGRRTAQLGAVLSRCADSGILVEIPKLPRHYAVDPDIMLEKLKSCGFRRLYLYAGDPDTLNFSELPGILRTVSEHDMPVHIVLPQASYTSTAVKPLLARPFATDGTSLEDAMRKIASFRYKHWGCPPCAGITVLAQPHRFTAENINRPHTLLYSWSDSTFGPGKDNDCLMRAALEEFRRLAELAADKDIPLEVAFPDFYHRLATDGKLTCGSAADFLTISGRIGIFNTGNKPSEMLGGPVDVLKNAPPGSVTIAILLAEHSSTGSGALRKTTWDDFIRSVSAAVAAWSEYPAFAGVVIGPLEDVDYLLSEE